MVIHGLPRQRHTNQIYKPPDVRAPQAESLHIKSAGQTAGGRASNDRPPDLRSQRASLQRSNAGVGF